MDQAPAASPLDIMQRLRVQADITGLLKQRAGLTAADPMAQFKLAGLAAKLTIALKKLGADLRAPAREKAAFATTDPEVPEQPRVLTAKFFDFDPNRKHSDRKRDNQQAMSLLKQIEAGDIDASKLDDAQKEVLARYSGTGGNLVGADGKKGSAYEYYTPKPIASGMWDLLAELGFKGGKVLDPCAGVGIFGATAPGNVAMESVELNETSGRVNQLVNGGPGYNAIISPFEAVANRTADESYDAVISNVPFGDVHDRGANRKIDPRYQDAPLETYFILRSLEKLKPGGLSAFIVPPRVVSAKGGREEKLRIAASYMAEFMGAYRLPNSVFGTADADTITDVIVFRKFSREAAAKIEEVRQQNPAVLRDANVQWIEFISGQYFLGEGKRFMLGEFQAKDPNKFRDVDRVISDASVANIGKMMRKFGASRIDWKLLEATETDPISYNEGDTITLAGQTLRMQEGAWVAIGAAPEDDSFDSLGSVMGGPVLAVTNKVTWEQADGYVKYLRGRSMEMDLRDWLRAAHRDIGTVNATERVAAWEALSAGLAAVEAIQTHASTPQFNYAEEYPVVSAALVSSAQTAKKTFAAFSREGKSAIVKHRIVYEPRKKAFDPLWLGEGAAEVADVVLGAEEKVANLQYTYQSAEVDVSKLAEVYGEAFNVHESDDWCINGDGTKAKRADDYYSGNYGDFLARIDAEIAAAPEGVLRDKLTRQKSAAAERVEKIDPEDLRFTLFSPFVTMEEKAEFLRRFMHPAFTVAFNDDGEKTIICDIGSPKTERERQLKRFAEYLKKGNLSTRSKDGESAELDKARRKMLRDMAMTANSQFDQWAKANPIIMDRMRETANDPARLYFTEIDDNSPLPIPGMNQIDPLTGNPLVLHGYQNAYVRKQGRSFGGINGFDVGLGKCQDVNEPILTPNGWKRMGDIAIGDMVIAVDGTPTEVLAVYPQGMKPSYELTFSDGAKARSCDEHLWFTNTESDRKIERYNRSLGRTVEPRGSAKSLAEIKETLVYQTQRNHRIPMVEPVQFAEKALPVHPYLLGVVLGDGAVPARGAMYWHKPDAEIADMICSLDAGSGQSYEVRSRKPENRCERWTLDGDMGMAATMSLRSLGMAGLVSYQKWIPDIYMLGSVEQRTHLLRGLMDTDGYASKDGVTVQYTSTSRKLADQVRELVMSLGGIAWITSKIPTFSYKGEKKQGREAFTVCMRMPPAINPFALARKADRVKPKSKYLPVRFIESVDYIGEVESQCIAIAHPTRLYVTRDYVVTHNTFTALASTQYVHSIGVKKKTMFVVPNSVLSNWRREVSRAYTSMDDCLFIGLDINEKTGKAVVNSANYARDFTRVLQNQHRKIFCTLEAFTTIPLKDETIDAYDEYLTGVDPSYEGGDRKADSERAASKRADATTGTGAKSSAIPYFEDMDVDSLVIDEGHMFKNSKNTVDFAGAKFLSVAEASQRGLDMQMKAWYIRGESELNDGVLPLTATPITNSPLEIYSMLCLAVGDRKVHDLMMGAKGADAFMNAMCQIEDDEDVTIDGRVKPYRVFRGLQNVNLLRSAISAIATIKTAADVKLSGDDLKLPDSPEEAAEVRLTPAALKSLNEYKMAYRAAKFVTGTAAKDATPPTKEELEALKVVQARFGEEAELIGHPFNLIQKMTLLIADPELDERATFYSFLPAQQVAAEAAIAAFNKLGRIEARALPGPHTEESAVVGSKTIKDGDSEVTLVKIKVQARIVSAGRIVIDTMDTNLQLDFERAAEKAKLDLDCTIPPKLAAMLGNVQREEAHPRSESGRVKQLIFCDILPLHNKIKRILTKHAGIPASAIEIISGQTIKNAEQMQGIQDGFNAEGEDNKFRTIIANEKAEVGINLQKGTQAIHHMTIGWTPDSQHQRNGRGVRQGNTTGMVRIYHYDADGTFDEYKRTLTTKKSDWIGAVMDKQGANEVTVSGGLSNDQYDELIESMGDANAVAAIKDRAALREKLQRAETAKAKQIISLRTATAQAKFVKQFGNVQPYLIEKGLAVYDLRVALATMKRRTEMKMSAGALIKLESRIADTEARLRSMERELTDSAKFEGRNGANSLDEAMTPNSWAKSDAKKRESIEDRLKWMLKPVEGSVLHDEWQQQIDSARSMAEEAFKEFAKIGESDQGGYPAAMGEAYRNGNATILDGTILAKGMFLRTKDGALWIVRDTSKAVRFPNEARGLSDALSAGWAVIGTDSPEYTACLREAAAFDDAAKGVALYNMEMLFTAVNPDVGPYRQSTTRLSITAGDVILPAPMFRYAVNPEWLGASEALAAIGRAQTGVLGAWNDTMVEVDSTGPWTKIEGYASAHNAGNKVKALRDWALAQKSPMTLTDYALITSLGRTGWENITVAHITAVSTWPTSDEAFAEFQRAGDEAALDEAAAAMLRRVLGDWLVIDERVAFSTFARSSVIGAFNSRRAAIRRAAAEAEAAAAAAVTPQAGTPEPGWLRLPGVAAAAEPVMASGAVAPNAKGLIGIKGETRPHKEVIKVCAKLAGGYARWNGQGERWDVPAAAWDRLVADHPLIAQVLYVVPA